MASGRERLRNLAAATHPTYGETFLDQTDRSASSSGAASAQEHVPESQSQGRSSAQEYVPPAQYELPPYYPQYEADYQPQYKAAFQPPPQQQPPPPAPVPEAPPASPAPPAPSGFDGATEIVPKKRGQMVGISTVNDVPRARAEYAATMWQNVRPTINPDPTLEEQADLEQRSSVHHSAEIFDDINLNN
ncbi:hypothetical protein Bca4012_051446 [Brassica carinata]